MKLACFFCFLGFFVYTYNGELQGQVLEDIELTKLLMIKSIGEWLVGLTFLESLPLKFFTLLWIQ